MLKVAQEILQRKTLLVYSSSPQKSSKCAENRISFEVDATWASEETIYTFFKRDSRQSVFLNFLMKDFIGLILHRDNTWMAYAWMTTPSTTGPPHLPEWVSDIGVYWIFYCRTREAFRGQGLYKLALQLLIDQAQQRPYKANVLIDTSSTNIPSRRAIISTGFYPKGAIVAYQLKIPKLGRRVWGNWRRDFIHPPLPGVKTA